MAGITFMQYIVFDLEATCWNTQDKSDEIYEIIEIGAVKLNEKAEQVDTYQTFIKPVVNPILSEFCTELTSIKQSDVDTAPCFLEVMRNFENWIDGSAIDTTLLSWGRYDKKQILMECEVKKYDGQILNLLNNHHSLKHDFAKMRKVRPCGMAKALKILDLPLIGTHHRGIDDALNISKIFQTVFIEWKTRISY